MKLKQIVGINIKKYREKSGLTQAQLAEKVGTSMSHISNIENGKKTAGLEIVKQMADSLGVKVDTLMQDESQPPNEFVWENEIGPIMIDCNYDMQYRLVRMMEYNKKVLMCQSGFESGNITEQNRILPDNNSCPGRAGKS